MKLRDGLIDPPKVPDVLPTVSPFVKKVRGESQDQRIGEKGKRRQVEQRRPPRDADDQRQGQPEGADREPAGKRQDSRPADRPFYALFLKYRYSAVSAYPTRMPATKNVPCWI